MPRFTEKLGVYFTEDDLDLPVLAKIVVKADTQNTTLADIKVLMARQALAKGGNGIVRFTYTQKADSPLRNVFSFRWDTERLTGTGDVVVFAQDPRSEGDNK